MTQPLNFDVVIRREWKKFAELPIPRESDQRSNGKPIALARQKRSPFRPEVEHPRPLKTVRPRGQFPG